jgi:hypothetical protein
VKASKPRGSVSRRRRQSPATPRVVSVRTGPLSQVQQGRKWQERATRKCPVYRALNSGETENRRHSRRSSRRATVAGRSVGEGGNHWRPTESCASVQDLSLRFSKAQSGRSAQRASDLPIVLSAMVRLEIVGAPEGRESEQPSRASQSMKAAITGDPQSRTRPYRTSLSGSARPKVAGARNAQVPVYRARGRESLCPSRLGSHRITQTVGCGGHRTVALRRVQGRLRARRGHGSSGSS